jgi:photosystem II stability/assembly factor-like uncharacterized protein
MRIRCPRLARLVRHAGFLSVAVGWPFFACAQGFGLGRTTTTPTCSAFIQRAQLVSPRTGWAILVEPSDHPVDYGDCAQQHLYWTENYGKTWRETTPPRMPTRSIGHVYFLDHSHGWIISTDALNEEVDARFYLHSTEDGGKTWRALLMQRATYDLRDDSFPSHIVFTDARHGWMFWHWSMMNSRLESLLATTDGGRTWRRLPDPPGPGPASFISARDGWIVGASEGFQGIPYYEDDELWATHDGGMHWQALHATLPTPGEDQRAAFSAVKFKNALEGVALGGVMPFALRPDHVWRAFAYFTHDGGKTWHSSSPDNPTANQIDASIVGTHVIWLLSDFQGENVEIRNAHHVIKPVFPAEIPPEKHLSSPGFVDDLNGWIIYSDHGPRFDAHGQPLASSGLLSTNDGGKTFQIISPPAVTMSVPISIPPRSPAL